MHRLILILISLALLLTPTVAMADAELETEEAASEDAGDSEEQDAEAVSFSSDRPGFGNATSVMAPLRFGFELGVDLDSSSDGIGFVVPNLLVRAGLTSWLEARFAVPSLRISPNDDLRSTNAGVGIKVAFDLHEHLAMSYVSMLDTPVVISDQGAGFYNGVNLAWQVSDTFGLAATAMVTVRDTVDDNQAHLLGWEAGGSLSLIANVSDDASLYVETNGVSDHDGVGQFGFGVGTTQMLTDTIQFDLFLSYSLGEAGTTVVIGSGTSFML